MPTSKISKKSGVDEGDNLKRSTTIARIIIEDEFPTARKTGRVVAQGDNAGTRTRPATAIFSIGWL